MKQCLHCHEWKETNHFSSSQLKRGTSRKCQTCVDLINLLSRKKPRSAPMKDSDNGHISTELNEDAHKNFLVIENRKLKLQIANLSEQNNKLAEENQRYITKNTELNILINAELETLKAENESLKKELATLSAELEDLKHRMKSLQDRLIGKKIRIALQDLNRLENLESNDFFQAFKLQLKKISHARLDDCQYILDGEDSDSIIRKKLVLLQTLRKYDPARFQKQVSNDLYRAIEVFIEQNLPPHINITDDEREELEDYFEG